MQRFRIILNASLNYIPGLIVLVFSMLALYFSILLIEDYKDTLDHQISPEYSHAALVDQEHVWQKKTKARSLQLKLYWAVIALGFTGFILVLLNSDKLRKLKAARKKDQEMQAQLYQAQKMEAIGRLAGGIAHDFNNILAAMNGNAEFLVEDLDKTTPQHKFAANILQAGQQARGLVDQILTFSRRQDNVTELVDLTAAVQESVSMLSAGFPKSIELSLDVDAHAAHINGNPNQISQVVVNLCVNARDAIEDDHGQLSVELKMFDPQQHKDLDIFGETQLHGAAHLSRIEELSPSRTRLVLGRCLEGQDYVGLSVSDTGSGMSRAIMEHIFEPFFTTKSVEKGTGLGLATVHGVLLGHKGVMVVDSTINQGTMFLLLFPVADGHAAELSSDLEVERGDVAGRILIVEDQDHVRDMMSNMLGRLGYEHEACSTGLAALKLLRKNPGKIDLVITDQNMPKMSGLELVNQASVDFPDLPFILLSGYSEQQLQDLMKQHPSIKEILRKPVSRNVLSQKIAAVLRDNPASKHAS